MYGECLSTTTEAAGLNANDVPSFMTYGDATFDLYDLAAQLQSTWRVTEVHICTGINEGHVKGFWFTLSDPEDSDSETYDLPAMGRGEEDIDPNVSECTSFDM